MRKVDAKLPAALVALASAATLVALALPASAAGARSFRVSAATVHAGQQVKAFGKGCGSQALVRIYLSGIEIDDDRADRAGAFNDEVEIPASVDPGQYLMKAGCSGRGLGSVKLTVLRSRFGVSPRSVAPGGAIKVTGNGIDVTNSGEPGKPVGPADVPKNVQVLRNKVSNVLLDGIAVSASGVGQYELRGNHALRNAKVGIHLGEKTDDALLANNTARGNGVLDCQDESPPGDGTVGDGTAGTENTWRNNVGPNDDPDGICHKHHHKKKRHRPDPCGCPASSWRLGV